MILQLLLLFLIILQLYKIGRGGATLRQIESDTNTRIKIINSEDVVCMQIYIYISYAFIIFRGTKKLNHFLVFKFLAITGLNENIEKSKKRIYEIIRSVWYDIYIYKFRTCFYFDKQY